MNQRPHYIKHRDISKKIVCIVAVSLTALITTGLSHAATPGQIRISQSQIQRSGIQTEAAMAPAAANAPATSTRPVAELGQHLSGTVVAPTNAVNIVSAMVSGVVQKIHVNSLQQVQSGTIVATLFSQQLMEMQREYLQLATQARLSRDKLERDESLFKEGVIALGRLQESRGNATQANVGARERYQSLRAAGMSDGQLQLLLGKLALSPYLAINAGTRGTLLELNLTIGQRIEAGMPIAKISKDTALWIEFQASRQQAEHIRIGDNLLIKGCPAAKVIAVSPQVNGVNQSTLIRAQQSTNDGCLKLNQFVEANHSTSTINANSIGVPGSAIVKNGSDSFVFVKNEQGFEAVKVQVMPGGADKVWVTGKLKAGSQVAVKGIVALKGAWIGLGADESAPAATVTTSAAAVTDNKKSGDK